MTDQTHQLIADEFPYAWLDSPPPMSMLVSAYNELRNRATLLESASRRVAELDPAAGIGPTMVAKIVEEAQAALRA
jgi:TFIIF-interacting CTD phosphatase-like protein